MSDICLYVSIVRFWHLAPVENSLCGCPVSTCSKQPLWHYWLKTASLEEYILARFLIQCESRAICYACNLKVIISPLLKGVRARLIELGAAAVLHLASRLNH